MIRQPFENYLTAGYNAFHMASSASSFGIERRVERIEIPYNQKPYSELWLKGWRVAQQEYEQGIPFRYNPFKGDTRFKNWLYNLEAKENRQYRKPVAFKPEVKTFVRPTKTYKPFKSLVNKSVPNTASPTNLGKLDRLNQKFRTKA